MAITAWHHTLLQSPEQRYPPGMALPEPRPPEDGLSHLYALAEGLAANVSVRKPDWSQIAADARELAERADRLCPVPKPLSAQEN